MAAGRFCNGILRGKGVPKVPLDLSNTRGGLELRIFGSLGGPQPLREVEDGKGRSLSLAVMAVSLSIFRSGRLILRDLQ